MVLDAGHGGHDSGARSAVTGVKEKDLALDVVQRVRRELPGQQAPQERPVQDSAERGRSS